MFNLNNANMENLITQINKERLKNIPIVTPVSFKTPECPPFK